MKAQLSLAGLFFFFLASTLTLAQEITGDNPAG